MVCGYCLRLWVAAIGCGCSGLRLLFAVVVAAAGAAVVAVMVCGSGCEIENEF